MFRADVKPQDLVILGGGAAATAALMEIINEFERRLANGTAEANYSITVIERNALAGAGYPYDPAQHNATLKVNDANPGMQLSKDEDKLNDFVVWLKERSEQLKVEHPQLSQIIDDNNSGKERYAPRMLFGIYCREQFNKYVEKARQLGVKVNVITNSEVVDAQKINNDWILTTKDNDKKIISKNILVATGHLPSRKFTALETIPNYLDSPYVDLSNLPNEPVFIMGSGLSAIDTVKLLVLNKNHTAPVYIISPSGQLPRIKGPANPVTYVMKYLTREYLDKKDMPLSEILDLFVAEVRAATGDSSWDMDSIMYKVRQEDKNPLRALKNEIALVESNQLRDWQRMMGETWYEAIPLIWKNMADCDRPEFI